MSANKSHLLINEPALQVLPSLAKAIGLEEAIILQQLHYWLNNPHVEGREHGGRKWIYNSYQEWQENFPFWSVQQIQRIFLNLERGGIVIAEKLDAKKHDQTKFYTLDYDALCAMEHIKFDSSSISNSSDVKKELTETTTEKEVSLTPSEVHEAGEKVDKILAMQANSNAWQGRELIRPDLLPLADCYNALTNQVMTKRVQKSWWKALGEWKEEGLDTDHIRAAYENNAKWRTVSDPNMLTKDAVAIKAAGGIQKEVTKQIDIDEDGIPETY